MDVEQEIEQRRAEERAAHEARVKAWREQLAATLADAFPEPVQLTLEIGSGHGHFLTAYAETHPEEHCVGIDIVSKRVRKGEAKQTKRSLDRLRFLKAEAREFLEALPPHVSLAKTFILFPDPWPKKRHWKNRIVQEPLLGQVARRTAPGGLLLLRTDHEHYFDWMVEHVGVHPAWEIDDSIDWPFEAPSFFQDLMESWQSLIAVRVDDAANPVAEAE